MLYHFYIPFKIIQFDIFNLKNLLKINRFYNIKFIFWVENGIDPFFVYR